MMIMTTILKLITDDLMNDDTIRKNRVVTDQGRPSELPVPGSLA